MKKLRCLLAIALSFVILAFTGCQESDFYDFVSDSTVVEGQQQEADSQAEDRGDSSSDGQGFAREQDGESEEISVEEDGYYTSKEAVALYIHEFGHLPDNFISKTKAREAGWDSSDGNLDEVLPGMSIGGSVFKNYEGQLPDADGRVWKECDINYQGGYRGAERIVFSNDGLVYYTGNHYETFEQLY